MSYYPSINSYKITIVFQHQKNFFSTFFFAQTLVNKKYEDVKIILPLFNFIIQKLFVIKNGKYFSSNFYIRSPYLFFLQITTKNPKIYSIYILFLERKEV
jgi:hypothetical protein